MKHSKRLFSSLFYVPKYEKVSDKSFSRIMLSSVFGILICGICLVGLTWAWFTGSVSSTANNITAAKFTVDISVTAEGTDTPLTPTEENGGYKYDELTAGEYNVTVTADSSATATTGYCRVELDGNSNIYHTVQLFTEINGENTHSVTFTVTVSQTSSLTISPQWGTYAKQDGEKLIGSIADENTVNNIATTS